MRSPSNIFPSLTYDDAPAAIAWLCEAFGFERRLVVPGPGGTVMHSELSLGPGVIMVSSARPDEGRLSPRGLAGVHDSLCLRVADPDAHLARARAAGARVLRDIRDEDYGARGFMVADPEGHQWYVSDYDPGGHWDAGDGID